MIYSYKITKYKPGSQIDSGWTSFSDIGKLVTEVEYLSVEESYINAVISICHCMKIEFLIIKDIELYSDISIYHEGQKIDLESISNLLRMILRECIWCKLISDGFEFHFGYDYYMYFVSRKSPLTCFREITNKLFVEEYKSPYL